LFKSKQITNLRHHFSLVLVSLVVMMGVALQTNAASASGTTDQFGTNSVITADGSGSGNFNDVSCFSTTSCVAVGDDGNSEGIYSIGTQINGDWTWSTSAVIPGDNSGGGALFGVSCASATSCIAVGGDSNFPGQEIYSAGTAVNGSWTWSASTVVPADSSGGGTLFDVHCVSATFCVAVGQDNGAESIYSVGTETGGHGRGPRRPSSPRTVRALDSSSA
jgi:hypothetical protein